jgi:hypothetical protein
MRGVATLQAADRVLKNNRDAASEFAAAAVEACKTRNSLPGN